MPSMFIEEKTIEAMAHEIDKAKSKLADIKEKSAHAVREGMTIAEVSVATLGFSFANARYADDGELKVAGIPVDLASAVALHLFAWLGFFKQYEVDGHNLGTGALASYLARLGTHLGATSKAAAATAAAPATAKTAGMFGTGAAAYGNTQSYSVQPTYG